MVKGRTCIFDHWKRIWLATFQLCLDWSATPFLSLELAELIVQTYNIYKVVFAEIVCVCGGGG